jgi:hypothetical protein
LEMKAKKINNFDRKKDRHPPVFNFSNLKQRL